MTTASPTESAELSPLCFERLAVLAVSPTAQVDLCRVVKGEHYGAFAAVKRLQPDISEDPELRNMFRDEIWMATALDHPNVARVLGWGEDTTGPFLASEFVRGVSLARLMRTVFSTGEAFTERLIVFVASKICAGLAAAHNLRSPQGEFLNLVHRDLTPGNVLLGFDGAVKITDFGLAKAKQRVTQTAVGMTKGDPAYMSPEQVLGTELDGRSDIFGLGIVVYELFAQRRPWTVTSVEDALRCIVEGDTPPLAQYCPRIDARLVTIVERCLAKKQTQRYQSAAELHQALEEWLMLHGYQDSEDTLARFVRRNAMRQMRWVDRAMRGELKTHDPRKSGPSPLELSRDEPRGPFEPPPPGESSAPIELKATSSGPATQVTEATTMRRPRHRAITSTGSRSGASERHSTTPASRMRDEAPPFGATSDSQIPLPPQQVVPQQVADAYARAYPDAQHGSSPQPALPSPVPPQSSDAFPTVPHEALPGATLKDHDTDEPSTLRRGPLITELSEVARRISLGASALADKAARAAHEAREAAAVADTAARRAASVAARAEQAADAARLAAEALERAHAGDIRNAVEMAQKAKDLHSAAAVDKG